MHRIRTVAPEYWFELLIAVMAIAGMLELVVGRDSPGAPGMSLWFSIPAVAILVLPLFVRRRFPFAAPAAYWLIAAALTYVDGLLIPFIGSLGVIGKRPGLHSRQVRGRLGRRVRTTRAFGAGRGGRDARDPRRARARGGGDARDPRRARARGVRADRSGRGARTHRARAPRHRRPRDERDGAPGRSRPTPAPARTRGGQRGA